MPTTTTTDPGTLFAGAANSLTPGLLQFVGTAVILTIAAVTITVVWKWLHG